MIKDSPVSDGLKIFRVCWRISRKFRKEGTGWLTCVVLSLTEGEALNAVYEETGTNIYRLKHTIQEISFDNKEDKQAMIELLKGLLIEKAKNRQ